MCAVWTGKTQNDVICKLSGEIKHAKTEITKDYETAQLWSVH